MNAEAIRARLSRVRPSGSGWIARCPAHEDRSPSLSVSEGSDGRVLLHCFAGCNVEAICRALGIRVNELFAKRRQTQEPHIVRAVDRQIAGFRSHLTPRERERPITVVLANEANLDAAIARALALAVQGELVQVALDGEGQ